MGSDSHIVRFKIVSISCAAMREGQQYTVYYRRGDTRRSTPCYVAHGGAVDFSSMPEGAAVINFKRGHGGRIFAPKYIQFRLEEYTRGAPRLTVAETELDCAQACVNNSIQGGCVLQTNFRLYGQEATMRVAVLVYREQSAPLSFDALITPGAAPAVKSEVPPEEVKFMARGEAMTLLISLETMLERKKKEEADGKAPQTSKAERRLRELEVRRKSLTGTEGMATRVVAARCHDCIDAQFVALARKTRNNFIGATAAYLRQLALQSGVPLTGGDEAEEEMDEDTMREQLARGNRRIAELAEEVKRLEEQQVALGHLQHKVDVTQELCANLEKVAAVQSQQTLLEQSKAALTLAMRSREAATNTPINREVKDINDRVKVLVTEEEQLRAKVRHMTSIASSHVLSWARAKNPPEPERPQSNVDDLFSDVAARSKDGGTDLNDAQRKQILSAFQGVRPSAPLQTARSDSDASSSGHRTPRDLFDGLDGLPSMGNFTDKPKKPTPPPAAPAKAQPVPQYQDPLKPAGLGAGMFGAQPAPSPNNRGAGGGYGGNAPTAGEFSFGDPSATTRQKQQQEATFDFGAVMRQAESAFSGPGSAGGGGGGFSLEPVSFYGAQPASQPAFSFGAVETSATPTYGSVSGGSPPAVAAVPYNKLDDPYYDDMDDYTIPADVAAANAGTATVEGFNFGLDEGSVNNRKPAAAAAAPPRSTQAPARPTFNFGPPDDDSGGYGGNNNTFGSGQPATAGFTLEGASSFSFGDGDEPTSTPGSAGTGAAAMGFTNLPTYNFGS